MNHAIFLLEIIGTIAFAIAGVLAAKEISVHLNASEIKSPAARQAYLQRKQSTPPWTSVLSPDLGATYDNR